MSVQESKFLKWFGGISAALVASFIIGGIIMFRVVGIAATNIEFNRTEILETKDDHKDDMSKIYRMFGDIRTDQKTMRTDIKELLKK